MKPTPDSPKRDLDHDPDRRYAATRYDNIESEQYRTYLKWVGEPSDELRLESAAYYGYFKRNWYKLDKVTGAAGDKRSIHEILAPANSFTNELAVLQGTAAGITEVKANNRSYASYGWQNQANFRFETGPLAHDLAAGLRFHYDYQDRDHWLETYNADGAGNFNFASSTRKGQDNRLEEIFATAIYLEDEIKTGELTLRPGIRYEWLELDDRKTNNATNTSVSQSGNEITETGLYKRSRTGVNYPYIYPGKEIEDKIPTINIDSFTTIDGGPYPSSSEGPIHLWTDTLTWVKGRHTMKAGVAVEYSGEDDFDQINVNSIPGGTNNQNGQFAFRNSSSTARTGLGIADMALGIFQDYAEIGERARTNWRALATDFFVQDSWRPTNDLTIEGGIRYALWEPWYSTTNNIANFDPRFYDRNNAAVIDPKTGRLLSGPRYNGIVLPGDGFVGAGNDLAVASNPAVQALFRGEPRGFSQTHHDLIEPRVGMSYSINPETVVRGSGGIFHNRIPLNDSTLLGGNPPFQPMVTVSNGSVDNPGGVAFANDLPFGMQGQDVTFKIPASYMWSAGIQRQLPWKIVLDVTYVGRRGVFLQRERNVNQLQAGTLQANPGINIAALRPYKGYGALRVTENTGNSKYNSLQISGERRYSNGFKLAVAYTYGKSFDNGSDKRNVLWNTYDESIFWGPSSFDRTHALVISYIYDLPFWRDQSTLLRNLLGGWQISGATFIQSGTPFSITRTNDIAGVGEGSNGQPVDLIGDPLANASQQFSDGKDDNFWFNPAAFANPAAGKFGNSTRNLLRNPGAQQWDIALFKNFVLGGTHRLQFRAEVFNFINHPNLSGPNADITNPNFGRVIAKDGSRRDIQLALRYYF